MKKSIVKNTLFNVMYRLLNVLFPMITAMYVARVLLPAGVGKVSYAQNILSYFTMAATLGIPTYGAREAARVTTNKKESDKLFSELFILNFISTLVCSFIYVALIYSVHTFLEQKVLFWVVGLPLFLNVFNVDWFYYGNEDYAYITLRSTAVKIISVICIFIFVKNENSLVIYALISSLAVSGNYLLNIIHIRKYVKFTLRNISLYRHLKPVFILLLTMLATDLYNQVDVTMMGSMCSSEEIGYYSYATKMVRIIYSISTAIAITTLPRLSNYYIEKKEKEFRKLFDKTMKVMLIFVVPCTLGITLITDMIVSVVYGKSFLPSVPIIKVAAPLIMIVTISFLCGSVVLTAVNKEKYLLLATISGMCVNVLMNVTLIPKMAGKGAAIASVCGELTVMLIHIICARRFIGIDFTRKDLFSVFVSAFFLIGTVIFMRNTVNSTVLGLIATMSVGAAIYFGMLYLLGNTTVRWIIGRINVTRLFHKR